MRLNYPSFFVSFALALPLSASMDFEQQVLPMLEASCINCHSEDEAEAGLDLERYYFSPELASADRAVWKKVFDKLESRQMPPPKREAQPSEEERRLTMAWIEHALAQPDPQLGAADPGKPVLRRLNRLEYNNTLRDLFGFDRDVFVFNERLPIHKDYFRPDQERMPDEVSVRLIEYGGKYPVVLPQAGLPGDGRAAHGYGNRGDTLNLSGLLLEAYIQLTGELLASEAMQQSAVYRSLMAPVQETPGTDPQAVAGQRISGFLGRAFRRPPSAAEAALYAGLYDAAMARGAAHPEAMKTVLQAVLLSPGFLYRSEPILPDKGAVRPLDGYELASRLSYFLWSSMPDDELFALAASGELSDPEVLAAQARRMLRDKRVRELSDSFAVQWLRLDQLFASKPDRDLFPGFYSGPQGKTTLHGPALVEPILLFETILIEDRSILDFLDADYTYLNDGLRKLYGMPAWQRSPEQQAALDALPDRDRRRALSREAIIWRRTEIDDPNRGGVMTMAGPLIVTSLPTRTSPVKRGAWILETIANRPPDEPKVAFSLDSGTGDKKEIANLSVRERFEAHRTQPACYSCHVRLDPPGFALEAFSPIGTWRDSDGGAPVDASGEWNGRPFRSPAGFKQALMDDPTEFVRGFVEHLLTYALGRHLEHYDMTPVGQMRAAVEADGYRFGSAIEAVVTSYPFRHVRNYEDEPTPSIARSVQP